MSCQSCVKNIEGTIGSRPGVVHVKVILEEKVGHVTYKTNETSPTELVNAIRNMNFDAFLPPGTRASNSNNSSPEPVISNCIIHIDGMTCKSCVNNITGKKNYLKNNFKIYCENTYLKIIKILKAFRGLLINLL